MQQTQSVERAGSRASTRDVNTVQNSGIPAGTAAPGSNPDSPSSPPDVITIGAEGCTVSEGASITLEDGDGTEARFVDGKLNIEIIGTPDEVTIEGPPNDFIGDHAQFPTSDTSFDTDGDYTVVSTTGITGCANTEPNQPSEGCTSPRTVDTFSGTENQRTDPFKIRGETFRLRFETDPVGQDPFLPSVEVDVLNENGQPIGQGFLVFDGEDGSENILAGPGTFSLEIQADEASYDITVEDCVGNDGGGGGGGGGGNRNNNDHNRHRHNRFHHNRFHHNDNAVHKQYVKTVEERVIKETIPNKGRLAATGGMPLAGVAFLSFAMVGLGISVLRYAIRPER